MKYLKRGISDIARNAEDQGVKAVVESALKEIETKGDTAVREYSERFDKYSPPSFKLPNRKSTRSFPPERSGSERHQVRARAGAQLRQDPTRVHDGRGSETLPGVILGHKNIPVQSVGCYVPGGKFPMVASAHMSVATASVAGVPRIAAATPPFNGRPNSAVIAAMHSAGRTKSTSSAAFRPWARLRSEQNPSTPCI